MLVARDLIRLICQDEVRNISRKLNAEKKKRGEEVKLGRRATHKDIVPLVEGIGLLALLIYRSTGDI